LAQGRPRQGRNQLLEASRVGQFAKLPVEPQLALSKRLLEIGQELSPEKVAERYYRQVLDRSPKEEEARFRMGYLRLQREDYRGAAEAFEGCLKYRPAWPEAHANLGRLLALQGKPADAAAQFEQPLNAAVFAKRPVQNRQKHVDVLCAAANHRGIHRHQR